MTFPNDASEFVYIRTYSRWIDELNRRETWEETVERFVNFIIEERGELIPSKVIRKIKEKILNFEVMPSMRALWSAGQAAKFDNTCMYNCAFSVVDSPKTFAETLYILMCGTGAGFSVQTKYIDSEALPVVPRLEYPTKDTHLVEDSRAGWADSVRLLIEALYVGKDIDFDYSVLRPKGARLKTMGGRSSGPAPLITLHSFIREIFSNAQGRKLTSLECHDIQNQVAESVVVGGVRRSSQISLSDLDDAEMQNAKQWPFPNRRQMANNSAVYETKPSAVEFLKEWSVLAASGTGERGIFNLEAARKNAPKRRDASKIMGTNPCVTGDTEILTDQGYVRIDSVLDQKVNIWNGFEWSQVTPSITGYNQPLVTITFSNGRSLTCTEYHRFEISTDYRGSVKSVLAKDLESGMKLIKHDYPIIEHGLILENAYTQGFASAEGMDGYKFLYVYAPKEMCIKRLNAKAVYSDPTNNRFRVTLNSEVLPKAFVPIEYNLKSKLDWLAGLFDGDGCELREGGLQLVSIDRTFLLNVQKLLTTIGVSSKIVTAAPAGFRELPNHKGGKDSYYCSESFRICIGAMQMQLLKKLGLQCTRLSFNKEPNRDASQFVTIVDVTESGTADVVYCFTEPKRGLGCFNGIVTGQCAEISLRNKGFCNLSEVVVRADDDLDSLLEKIETATWLGVIQSTFIHFPYLSKDWQENCEEERLLGVSLTGQMDNPALLTVEAQKILKAKVLKVARHASQKMGINMPAATTCVKPSGTVSQLVNSSSGIHPRHAKYYIRRYRISSTDPLFKMIRDQGIPVWPENGQEMLPEEEVSTWVLGFPIKSPDNCVTRHDVSAIDQLEWYKKVQTNYCEHNASMTVYVKDSEWFEVGNWVYQNWDIINGVSFLPHDGGKYKLAPYEDLTEDQYNKIMKNYKKIDYSQLSKYEQEDNTEGAKSYNCTGDKCELV